MDAASSALILNEIVDYIVSKNLFEEQVLWNVSVSFFVVSLPSVSFYSNSLCFSAATNYIWIVIFFPGTPSMMPVLGSCMNFVIGFVKRCELYNI